MKHYVGRRVKPGSTLENKTKSWRTKRPVFKQQECIGCDSCRLACPEGIIFREDKKKYDVNLDYCKGCGICAEECPVKDIVMQLESGCEEDGSEEQAVPKDKEPRE